MGDKPRLCTGSLSRSLSVPHLSWSNQLQYERLCLWPSLASTLLHTASCQVSGSLRLAPVACRFPHLQQATTGGSSIHEALFSALLLSCHSRPASAPACIGWPNLSYEIIKEAYRLIRKAPDRAVYFAENIAISGQYLVQPEQSRFLRPRLQNGFGSCTETLAA
jgi:hypothetical protein